MDTHINLSRQEREALLKELVARRARALQPEQWCGIDMTAKGLARLAIDTVRLPDSSSACQHFFLSHRYRDPFSIPMR